MQRHTCRQITHAHKIRINKIYKKISTLEEVTNLKESWRDTEGVGGERGEGGNLVNTVFMKKFSKKKKKGKERSRKKETTQVTRQRWDGKHECHSLTPLRRGRWQQKEICGF